MQASRALARHLVRSTSGLCLSAHAGPSLSPSRLQLHPRSLTYTRPSRATATTPHSSWKDPALDESQRQLELGAVALDAGNVADAKRSYLKAIEIAESASAYFNLGVCHYHEKDIDKAIEAWKETLRIAPDSADAHTNIASAYVMSVPSRPDLAVEHLKLAASITPDDPEVQFNLGAVLEACEQLEESIRAYERAHQGGIERALENIRNVRAKVLSIKLGSSLKDVEAAAKADQ